LGIRDSATAVAKRVVLWFAFQRAKQPERIKEVLQMVYSSNDEIDFNILSMMKVWEVQIASHSGAHCPVCHVLVSCWRACAVFL
jgi:hypothetical protein